MGAAPYLAVLLLIIIIGICSSESSLEESLMNIHGRELRRQPWRAGTFKQERAWKLGRIQRGQGNDSFSTAPGRIVSWREGDGQESSPVRKTKCTVRVPTQRTHSVCLCP